MVRSKFRNANMQINFTRGLSTGIAIVCICLLLLSLGCNFFKYKYTGLLNTKDFQWIKDKKIFIDPGHGGLGKSDRFRMGPGGVTEEEVNLRVALILYNMLEEAGAKLEMSRFRDKNVPLQERVDMVKEFKPDLMVSIHHNGTVRRADKVNYPTVLIWGSLHTRPLSYNFAEILLTQFHKIMEERGHVISDFSVFSETGTKILRETRYVCPGVIGEAGFFSDEQHSVRLIDKQYNNLEAEAYFKAIAEFFRRGLPRPKVSFSCEVDNIYLKNRIRDTKPIISLDLQSGSADAIIIRDSLLVTLDGLPVPYRFKSDSLCRIDYGKQLYPGGHNLRFRFMNSLGQQSMIYRVPFTVEILRGDYDHLVAEGLKLLKKKKHRREGLKMLLSAYSMGLTDPDAEKLLANIALGFSYLGDKNNTIYYYSRLYHFYPDSRFSRKSRPDINGYRFTVEYHGKNLDIYHDPTLVERYKDK